MKNIKKFESFINDTNRDSQSLDLLPKYNPIIIKRAKEYVEELSKSKFRLIFDIARMEFPRFISSQDMDEVFDEAKEKAVEYFIEHPEAIGDEKMILKQFPQNGGDGIPRVQNIGGTSHTSNFRIGESLHFDSSIEISEEDMEQFNNQEPLVDLVRNRKISLGNKIVKFNSEDEKTIKTLDNFFEFDKKSFDSDLTD